MSAQVAIVVPVDTAVKDFGRRESRYLVDNYVRKYCAIKNEVKMQIMIYIHLSVLIPRTGGTHLCTRDCCIGTFAGRQCSETR